MQINCSDGCLNSFHFFLHLSFLCIIICWKCFLHYYNFIDFPFNFLIRSGSGVRWHNKNTNTFRFHFVLLLGRKALCSLLSLFTLQCYGEVMEWAKLTFFLDIKFEFSFQMRTVVSLRTFNSVKIYYLFKVLLLMFSNDIQILYERNFKNLSLRDKHILYFNMRVLTIWISKHQKNPIEGFLIWKCDRAKKFWSNNTDLWKQKNN